MWNNNKYLSKDDSGNIYKIMAEYGEIKDQNSDLIFLKNVKAEIIIFDSDDIYIQSDFAKYNSKNYDTNFYENIKVDYVEHQIDCRYLDLLFNNNQAILYEDIIYKSPNEYLPIIGFALIKLSMLKIDSGDKMFEATPTSVEIIGVLVNAHSGIDWGPPSTLEATI